MKKFLIYSAVFALLFCSNFAMAQTSPPNNGPGGVSSRTPGSNLGLWLKGSEIVADQNGKLTIWNDVSGKDNNAEPTGTGDQITLDVNSDFGNKNVAGFTGGKFLRIEDGSNLDGETGLTVYTVISSEGLGDSSGESYFISKPDGSTVTSPYRMYFDNQGLKFDLNSGNTLTSLISINNPFNYLLSFEF